MGLQLYGKLLATINGEQLREQCAIDLVQAQGKPDRITIRSAVPSVGVEFNAHERIGRIVHVSLNVSTGRRLRGALEPGVAVVAYDARIVSAELLGGVATTTCSSFTLEAVPQPETP